MKALAKIKTSVGTLEVREDGRLWRVTDGHVRARVPVSAKEFQEQYGGKKLEEELFWWDKTKLPPVGTLRTWSSRMEQATAGEYVVYFGKVLDGGLMAGKTVGDVELKGNWVGVVPLQKVSPAFWEVDDLEPMFDMCEKVGLRVTGHMHGHPAGMSGASCTDTTDWKKNPGTYVVAPRERGEFNVYVSLKGYEWKVESLDVRGAEGDAAWLLAEDLQKDISRMLLAGNKWRRENWGDGARPAYPHYGRGVKPSSGKKIVSYVGGVRHVNGKPEKFERTGTNYTKVPVRQESALLEVAECLDERGVEVKCPCCGDRLQISKLLKRKDVWYCPKTACRKYFWAKKNLATGGMYLQVIWRTNVECRQCRSSASTYYNGDTKETWCMSCNRLLGGETKVEDKDGNKKEEKLEKLFDRMDEKEEGEGEKFTSEDVCGYCGEGEWKLQKYRGNRATYQCACGAVYSTVGGRLVLKMGPAEEQGPEKTVCSECDGVLANLDGNLWCQRCGAMEEPDEGLVDTCPDCECMAVWDAYLPGYGCVRCEWEKQVAECLEGEEEDWEDRKEVVLLRGPAVLSRVDASALGLDGVVYAVRGTPLRGEEVKKLRMLETMGRIDVILGGVAESLPV